MIKIELFRLSGVIELTDKVTKTLSSIDKKAENFGKKLDGVSKKMSGLGKNMSKYLTAPIAGVSTAVVGLATKVGNTADRLLDLSDITGMTTDALQEYEYVAKIAGVSTEAVSKASQGLIRRLPQLKNEGGATSDAIAELGVSLEGTADEIMDNLIVALAETESTMDRNAKGSAIFGGAWKDLAPILGMGADGIGDVRREARELGLVMGEDALNNANDFRTGVDRLKATFGGLFNELGAKFAPILTETLLPLLQEKVVPLIQDFADRIGGLVEWFEDLSPETQTAILAIGGLVAGIGPLLLIIGKVIGIITPLITLIGGAGGLSAVFTALTGPIGIIIAVIAGLVATFIYLYKNNEEFREKVTDIWNSIKDMFKNAFDHIMSVVDRFVEIFQILWEKYGQNIKNTITSVFKIVMSVFQTAIDFISDVFSVFSNLFKGNWSEMWESVKDLFGNLWDNIKNIFSSVIEFIKNIFKGFRDFVSDLWSAVWDGIKSVTKKVTKAIFDVVSGMIKSVTDRVKKFVEIGKDIVKGLWNGINDTRKWIMDKVRGFVGGIGDTIKGFFGIRSPSTLMAEYGKNIAEGLGKGIEETSSVVDDAMERLCKGTVKELGVQNSVIVEKKNVLDVESDSGDIEESLGAIRKQTVKRYRDIAGERGPEFLNLERNNKPKKFDKAKEIVINITGNTLFGERDADRLGELLVDRLKGLGVV